MRKPKTIKPTFEIEWVLFEEKLKETKKFDSFQMETIGLCFDDATKQERQKV